MSTLEAIVLGLVQGLTEFLPISSSGHLRIVPALLGWEDPGAGFTAVIQLGTMAAVLIYFRADLLRIAGAWLRELRMPIRQAQPRGEPRLVHHPRHDPDRDLRLHLQGPDRVRRAQPLPDRLGADPLLLRDARRRAGRHQQRDADRDRTAATASSSASPRRWPWSPASRAPGRRSPPACFRGFDRVAAARYSFLLSVPAVVLSGLFELRKVGEAGSPSVGGDGDRDAGRLRHRLRRDRLAAPLPRHPHAADLRRLPDRASASWSWS